MLRSLIVTILMLVLVVPAQGYDTWGSASLYGSADTALPGYANQTLYMGFDGGLPAGVSFARSTSAWSPSLGSIYAINAPRVNEPGKNGSQGLLVEGSSSNKTTVFSVPRIDSTGADISSGLNFAVTGWTSLGGGRYQSDGTGGLQYISTTAVSGTQYQFNYEVESYTSGWISPRAGSNYNGQKYTVGVYNTVVLANAATAGVYVGSFVGIIKNITIVPVTDPAAYTVSYYNLLNSQFTNNIPNMTLSGDTAAVLSIVTDQTAIDAAIAAAPTDGSMIALQAAKANGYKCYELTATANSNVSITASLGNTNPHTGQIVARMVSGAAQFGWSDTGGTEFGSLTSANSSYSLVKGENKTPSLATRTYIIRVPSSGTVRFLAPQLEESSVASSLILGTTGAATTRGAETATFNPTGIITPSAGTIMAWYKVDTALQALATNQFIFDTFTATDQNRIAINKSASNTWSFNTSTSAGAYTITSAVSALSAGWHHFAGVWGGANPLFYIDGVLVGTGATNRLPTTIATTAYIGSTGTGALQANSVIDQFRVFSRVLTAAEILTIFNRGK